ncbi:hypothetical protein [Nonomuraea sp. NPDC049709]|uniref:hypothetical protein n=1 Tax=Nonomuraea sp. NPDC049709 TaxID=3154736 RepID=UPI003416DD3A
MSAAVDRLRAQGVPVKDEDAAWLPPLGHAHLNVLGRYCISSSAPADHRPHQACSLRPPLHHPSQMIDMTSRIHRRRTVTGLINEYHRAA